MVTHLAECSQDILISLNLSNTFRWGHLLSRALLLLLKATFKLLGVPIKEEALWGLIGGASKSLYGLWFSTLYSCRSSLIMLHTITKGLQ